MNSSKYSENICKTACAFLEHLTSEALKIISERGLSLHDLFTLPDAGLSEALGLQSASGLELYRREEALARAAQESEFMDRHNIRVIHLYDEDYPWRLLETASPPKVLFCLGNASLNSEHNVSIVGTRRCTQAGIDFCGGFVRELAPMFPDLCVVSGLAYGIDSVAHSAAIEVERPTIAVLAHGLDTLYPAAHRNLAREIINRGGALVAEYPSGTKPFRSRFLERNRIVAALSDALVVVESEVKGGAMSTANTAFSYSREVFAVPGRPTDTMSSGCNHLIRKNKARILTSVSDFMEDMDWRPAGIKLQPEMRCLFPELEGNAKIVYDFLRFKREPCSVDSIHQSTTLPVATVMSVLGELEFDGIVVRLPGNRYEIS